MPYGLGTLAPPTTSCRGRGLLAKLNLAKFLSQYKALGFGEIFLPRKFCRIRYVAASVVTDRQTDTHRTTTVTLRRMRRGLIIHYQLTETLLKNWIFANLHGHIDDRACASHATNHFDQ